MKKALIEEEVELVIQKKKWSTEAHHTWQIDGKEGVELGNGDKVSWMNIADEGTTAHLLAGVVNCPTVLKMDSQQATHIVNDAFSRWGLPEQIKIDNGYPFVSPKHIKIPTKTKLWWIGLGIQVIQNWPRCPQQNGVVECLQGIMGSWSNPKGQNCVEALQESLNQESDFQRNDYQIPSKDYQTRIELHPELEQNPRKYNPDKFEMNLVYNFLSEQVWSRLVNNNGSLRIFGIQIYVGLKFKKENLTITFDPDEICWLIRRQDGTFLKKSEKAIPTEKEIKDFALCQ